MVSHEQSEIQIHWNMLKSRASIATSENRNENGDRLQVDQGGRMNGLVEFNRFVSYLMTLDQEVVDNSGVSNWLALLLRSFHLPRIYPPLAYLPLTPVSNFTFSQ